MANTPDLTIETLRGGYNDTDPKTALRPDECTQADDVEFFLSLCGERRLGTASLDLTSSGLTAKAGIGHLSEWFPTNVQTSPELFAIAVTDATSVAAARRDTGGTWHTLTAPDTINTTASDIYAIRTKALDGLLYTPYHGTADRMKVLTTASTWRLSGFGTPNAPTVADSSTGGGFTGKRYYRIRVTEMSGSTVLRRSEPSTDVAFTPAGTKNGAVITKPTLPGEGETHWEVEASEIEDGNWYRLAQVAVATTTYTDTTSSSKSFPAPRGAGAPSSNDGTSITYVLLSDQAAALNLTGTVSNGTYGNPTGTIAGRGWIGYDSGDVYIPSFPSTWTSGTKWYASPDVAAALEGQSSGDNGNYAAVGTLSDAVGAYLPLPSAKYVEVDGDRIIYAGHWTDTAQMSTVGWTPVKGDPGVGNNERAPIVTTGGDDITTTRNLDNYDGGVITGLAATSLGRWWVFKWQRIYSAVKTSNVSQAYEIECVTSTRGALPGSVVKATDAAGTTMVYFLDPNTGPCRMAPDGSVTVIRGLRTTWKRVNVKATGLSCCGVYYPYKQQVWWFLSVDGGNTPTLGIRLQTSELVMDKDGTLRRGWSFITSRMAQALCATTVFFTSGNFSTEIPFIGQTSPEFVQQCDTGTDDNGTAYTGTIVSAPRAIADIDNKFGVLETAVLADADANGQVKVSLVRDMNLETQPSAPAAASLAPAASETQVFLRLDSTSISELHTVQVKLTDGAAGKNWRVQRVSLKPRSEGSMV